MKKKNIFIIVLLLISIIIFTFLTINYYPDYQLKNSGIENSQRNNKNTDSQGKEAVDNQTDRIKKFCAPFASTSASVPISCAQAIDKALKEYPGTLKSVDIETSLVEASPDLSKTTPEEEEIEIKFWTIGISLKEKFDFKGGQIEEVVVKVNTQNGKLFPYKYKQFNKIEK